MANKCSGVGMGRSVGCCDSGDRVCAADAATGKSGMLELIKRAPVTIAVEGCGLQCGTEIMRYRVPGIKTAVVNASDLYSFDGDKYFEVFDMPRPEIEEYAHKVAEYVQEQFFAVTDNTCGE